ENAPGIGQDLVQIGEHIDVLSSMIYPSHWGPGSLDVAKPDLEPYETGSRYIEKEKEELFRMEEPPLSRPWIQDFIAPYLGAGNYQEYGKTEVEAQIKALNESAIDEYVIWNDSKKYTENVDYTPPMDEDIVEEKKKKDAELRQENEEENKEEKSDKNDDKENDTNEEENEEGNNEESGKDPA